MPNTRASFSAGLIAIPAAGLLLTGCASVQHAVEPTSIRVYAEHVSHLTQHAPIASEPTDFFYNTMNVEAHWQHKGVFLDVAEGVSLQGRDTHVPWQEYGALIGPREVFTARAGYEFEVAP